MRAWLLVGMVVVTSRCGGGEGETTTSASASATATEVTTSSGGATTDAPTGTTQTEGSNGTSSGAPTGTSSGGSTGTSSGGSTGLQPDVVVPEGCGGEAGLAAGASTPTWGLCGSHQWRSSLVGPGKGVLKWSRPLSGQVGDGRGAAVGADGTLYATNFDHQVLAIDPATGMTIWEYTAENLGGIQGHPALGASGRIYVTEEGEVLALDGQGKVVWRSMLGDVMPSSLALGADETIYARGLGRVIALSSEGAFLWDWDIGDAFLLTEIAVSSDGTVFVHTAWYDRAGELLALTPDGQLLWKQPLAASIASPVLGLDGTVYTCEWKGDLRALRRVDGLEKWSFTPPKGCLRPPAIGAGGELYEVGWGGVLHALDSEGASLWTFEEAGGVFSHPVVDAEGNLYLGAGDSGMNSRLVSLDLEGAERWSLPLSWGADEIAFGVDGALFVRQNDGVLIAVGD